VQRFRGAEIQRRCRGAGSGVEVVHGADAEVVQSDVVVQMQWCAEVQSGCRCRGAGTEVQQR